MKSSFNDDNWRRMTMMMVMTEKMFIDLSIDIIN